MSALNQRDATNLEGIAVIGMSGRFPGGANVQELWQNLVNGVDSISHFSESELEFSVASAAEADTGQQLVRARGVLKNVDQFDAAFFGMTPREAEVMDPQHRLFLECAWESLESAGYDSTAYGGLVGVFAGCTMNTYLIYNLCADRAFAAGIAGNYQIGNYSTVFGNDKDFMTTRVSYKLNLKGPSMAVQTACSTSLVAICQACTNLLTYQCDMALAGGVSISFPQKRDYPYQEGSLVSGDGVCRTFDAAADGTVFGNGVGVVLLKRLVDAMADGDNVLAVIKGTAVNNDGAAKVSYAAPSVEAQADVIAMAQAAAGVEPDSISYIEAHGTGTPLGDPIEIAALTKAFRAGGSKRAGYCAIGTVKTNISHLDIAAGVAGLIKTILQLQHEMIPALLHFKNPNPKIDFDSSPFFPAARAMEWKRGVKPRRAGVSSFGVGGTNAHVVVEEAPEIEAGSLSRAQQLLVLSAKTETALQKMTENLTTHLLMHPEQNLSDVAFTLKKGRKSFAHRCAFVARDVADTIDKLQSGDAKSVFLGKSPQSEPSVIFVFPGQGAQYVDMGRSLYDSEPVFRMEVDRCAEILRRHLNLDIRSILYPESASHQQAEIQINETSVTQPAIFTVEYALAKLWLSWGVKPAVLIGHSIGEYVAAVLAETFTLENALTLLAARAKLMQELPGGSMLAVRLDGKSVESIMPAEASIAALNSSKLCTVSGPTEVLKSFQSELEAKKIASRFLATSHAFHSAMMEPILAKFTEIARQTPWATPKTPWISTCTGARIKSEDLADSTYWSRQLRHTVRFADALDLAINDQPQVILEVGPGQALSQLAHQHPAKSKGITICSTLDSSSAAGGEQAFILTSLGKLWLAGVKTDWDGFYANEKRRRIPLPTYPFERKSHWVEPAKESSIASASRTPALSGNIDACENQRQLDDLAASPSQVEKVIFDQFRVMNEQLDLLQKTETAVRANSEHQTGTKL